MCIDQGTFESEQCQDFQDIAAFNLRSLPHGLKIWINFSPRFKGDYKSLCACV